MIFEDDSAVIGAPGPLTWRGAIFVSSVSDNYLERDKLLYEAVETLMGKTEDDENPYAHIRKVAYMGKPLALEFDYPLIVTNDSIR
jgi:hypothetical protein